MLTLERFEAAGGRDSDTSPSLSKAVSSLPAKDSYSFMVQAVKETRRVEKDMDVAARELILVGLTEEIKDSELTEYIKKVTNELNISVEASFPSNVTRLGRQLPNDRERKRLVKITFSSPESARLYKLAFDKQGGSKCFNFRLRNSLPPQMRYISKKVFKLNQESDAATSYSLRDDGVVWKFVKNGEKWERDFNWTENFQ